MHTSHNGPDPLLDPSKGYETRDLDPIKLLPILFFMAVFIFAASVIGYGVWYLDQGVSPYHKEAQLPRQVVRPLPASPVVQANPTMDIRQFRDEEYQQSHTYWVGPAHHLHIPISRAMVIVDQEGLPTRQVPATPDQDGPNEPSFMSGQVSSTSATPSTKHPVNGLSANTGQVQNMVARPGQASSGKR